MFEAIPKGVKLWPHQRAAINFVIDRLKGTSKDACLVRMPTGTGKTGVIACLSQLCAQPGYRILVLTPWANLRAQMVGDLSSKFWDRIGYKRPIQKVVEMLPTTAQDICTDPKVKVIVCTFSTLTEIKREDPDTYRSLSSFAHAVIVDECHYEPAVKWGKAVKELGLRTVLLTATPYRNDIKLFRIRDTKALVHQFTHASAESAGIIRAISIQELQGAENVRALASAFAKYWKEHRSSLPASEPRAIICCTSRVDIETTVNCLRKLKINAIGIHERFVGQTQAYFLRDVPSTGYDAEVWVHQNKLTEGLDDDRFCCLALFGQIRNDRKLIQQIGRVLRKNLDDKPNSDAVLLAPPRFQVAERWNAYRDFDVQADLLSPEHFKNVVLRLLQDQPSSEYFEGRFRRRFQPDLLSKDPQITVSPSILVRQTGHGFSFADYIEECTDTLNLTDAIILGEPNAPCQKGKSFALWVYASIGNSRLLESHSLYEIRLEAHCAVLSGDYLFISDTTGTYPEEIIEESTKDVGPSSLSSLMDDSFRVTDISVASVVPFDTVLRASEHRGHDLSTIPASLTDRIQICRSARGSSAKGRRYLGLQRGRVRQELSAEARRSHDLTAFIDWSKIIATQLSNAKHKHPVLQRYMQTCKAPAQPIPVSISIDINQSNIEIISSSDGTSLDIECSSVAVSTPTSPAWTATFSFRDESNTKVNVEVALVYQPNKGRFWFKTEARQAVHLKKVDDSSHRSLGDFLNQNQDLVLIGLEGGQLVYQGRNFYEVDYSYAEKSLLDQIERPTFGYCDSEKGSDVEINLAKKSQATTFVPGSLFKAIADGDLQFPFVPEVIICDDMATECADFVLVNFSERQLALVHAKASSGQLISASSFHDVVAQAMKNLVYLTRNAGIPEGARSWTTSTFWNGTRIPRLYKLSNPNYPVGVNLWHKIRADVIDRPDATLHVILATTGCCNRGKLEEAIRTKRKRTPETAQLLHLLDSLNGYSRQLGVLMKIYDIPYAP